MYERIIVRLSDSNSWYIRLVLHCASEKGKEHDKLLVSVSLFLSFSIVPKICLSTQQSIRHGEKWDTSPMHKKHGKNVAKWHCEKGEVEIKNCCQH